LDYCNHFAIEMSKNQLGAKVFLTRQSAEPVAAYDPQKLYEEEPGTFQRTAKRRFEIAKEVLFAKVIEQRASGCRGTASFQAGSRDRDAT
jgi:hypothetical protein